MSEAPSATGQDPTQAFPSELVEELRTGKLKPYSSDHEEQEAWNNWTERFTKAGGPEILKGLQLEVANGAPGRYELDTPGNLPSGSLYEVADVEIKQTQQEHYERTGTPFIHKRGGIFYAGRGSRPHTTGVSTPLYTINKYNSAGQLEDVLVYTNEQLTKLASLSSNWGMESPDEQETVELEAEQGNSREVQVDSDFGRADPFDSISRQLEDAGVHNWGGLTFKRTWQEEKTSNGLSVPDKIFGVDVMTEEPHKKTTKNTRTIKIIDDTLLADYHESWSKNARGSRLEYTFTRALLIEERNEEDSLVSKRVVKGNDIRKYFKGPKKRNKKDDEEAKDRRERFSDMHIEVPELSASQQVDEVTARRLEHEMARDETATLAYMLGYGDIIDSKSKDTAQEIKERMQEISKSAKDKIHTEDKRRMNALKELIVRHGMANIYTIAAELRDQFLESAAKLHLPTEFSDPMETKKTYGDSVSWALESMADRHYYLDPSHRRETGEEYEDAVVGDPIVSIRGTHTRRSQHTDRTRKLHREIVYEQLGWALISQTMHKELDREVVGVEDGEDGRPKPIYDIKEGVKFLEEPLKKLPELTREQVKVLEEIIYRTVEDKQEPRVSDLVTLGRALERSIGRRGN